MYRKLFGILLIFIMCTAMQYPDLQPNRTYTGTFTVLEAPDGVSALSFYIEFDENYWIEVEVHKNSVSLSGNVCDFDQCTKVTDAIMTLHGQHQPDQMVELAEGLERGATMGGRLRATLETGQKYEFLFNVTNQTQKSPEEPLTQ